MAVAHWQPLQQCWIGFVSVNNEKPVVALTQNRAVSVSVIKK
jgi:hypothetical protein